MSIGATIFAFVLSLAGSLIAACIYETYAKKRDNGDFKAETTALQLLEFAIAILPKEDRTKFYDQWFTDLIFLDTSSQRLRFACGLPQAAVILRTKALVSIPFIVITKQSEVVAKRVNDFSKSATMIIIIPFMVAIGGGLVFWGTSGPRMHNGCYNQDGHRVTCDTTHRPDLVSHPW